MLIKRIKRFYRLMLKIKENNAVIERRYKFNVILHRLIIKKRINIIVNNEDNNNDN